jgi:hypothetical protein
MVSLSLAVAAVESAGGVPSSWFFAGFGVLVLLGNYYFVMALRNLAPDHPDSVVRILFWSKLFARRENFTEVGWRYKKRAIGTLFAVAVWVVVWGILQS